MDTTELFLNIHVLHLLETYRIFRWVWLAIVLCRRLLAPCGLFLSNRHTTDTIIYIVALASEALEVISGIGRVDDGRIASFGLCALLLPAGVEELNYKRLVAALTRPVSVREDLLRMCSWISSEEKFCMQLGH